MGRGCAGSGRMLCRIGEADLVAGSPSFTGACVLRMGDAFCRESDLHADVAALQLLQHALWSGGVAADCVWRRRPGVAASLAVARDGGARDLPDCFRPLAARSAA